MQALGQHGSIPDSVTAVPQVGAGWHARAPSALGQRLLRRKCLKRCAARVTILRQMDACVHRGGGARIARMWLTGLWAAHSATHSIACASVCPLQQAYPA